MDNNEQFSIVHSPFAQSRLLRNKLGRGRERVKAERGKPKAEEGNWTMSLSRFPRKSQIRNLIRFLCAAWRLGDFASHRLLTLVARNTPMTNKPDSQHFPGFVRNRSNLSGFSKLWNFGTCDLPRSTSSKL